MEVAAALVAGGQRSAMVPAPTARQGDPKKPAKKRQVAKDVMLREKPAPSVKAAASGIDNLYTARRPEDSLMGAARTGPKASPRTYRETPSRATVVDTPNFTATSAVPGAYTEEPKETHSERSEGTAV